MASTAEAADTVMYVLNSASVAGVAIAASALASKAIKESHLEPLLIEQQQQRAV